MVPPCGSISVPRESDTALYFSLSGNRYIQSKRFDLTTARYCVQSYPLCSMSVFLLDRVLSFRLRIGGGGGCERAESSDAVVLEFAPLGTTAYTQITTFPPSGWWLR